MRNQGEYHGATAAEQEAATTSTLEPDVLRVVTRILRQYMSGDSFNSRLSGKAVLVLLLRHVELRLLARSLSCL